MKKLFSLFTKDSYSKSAASTLETQRRLTIILFVVAPLLLLLLFQYYPAYKQFELSFFDWNGFSKTKTFVGLENYVEVVTDKDTLMTLQNNFAYLAVMLVQTVLALYLAIVLDGYIRGKHLFRSIIFLPYILNGIAVAFMFQYLYNYEVSPVNQLLNFFGHEGIHFLGKDYWSNFSLALVGLWRYTGFNMVIFLGALQSISKEVYEAANIDGANYYQMIRHIVVPNIKRVINLTLLLGINGALQAYYEAFVITKGGPAGRTETFITSTLKIAFEFRNFGKASALAFVLLAMILMIIFIQRKFIREEAQDDTI